MDGAGAFPEVWPRKLSSSPTSAESSRKNNRNIEQLTYCSIFELVNSLTVSNVKNPMLIHPFENLNSDFTNDKSDETRVMFI